MEQLGQDFKENCIYRVEESMRMLRICKEFTTSDLFWLRPNDAANSIGNLLLHLCGNMKQYVLSGLGEKPDSRKRDDEFRQDLFGKPEEVWDYFFITCNEVIQEIENASPSQLSSKKNVQGFHLSGLGMVLHAVEHLSYHTGQIAWIIKANLNCDLGFYAGIDLNIKNESKAC